MSISGLRFKQISNVVITSDLCLRKLSGVDIHTLTGFGKHSLFCHHAIDVPCRVIRKSYMLSVFFDI